jgi:hypothetical protein
MVYIEDNITAPWGKRLAVQFNGGEKRGLGCGGIDNVELGSISRKREKATISMLGQSCDWAGDIVAGIDRA